MRAAPATRLCATTRKQGRNNAPGNTVQTARCANSWPSARPQHAQQLRARHVPALPHANQRCRTYSQQLHAVQAPFSVLQRSPELQLRQITRHCRDALLGACKTPHAPIYEAKPALPHRGHFSPAAARSAGMLVLRLARRGKM